MQSTTRVALDAMGGDNAPAEVVKGAVDAVNKRNDIKIFLIGQKVPVERELSLYTYPKEQIEIVDAPEVIEMAEPPVVAIRRKKQSSIVVGMNMVKNKEADAFVSAGSSGAVLVGGQVIVGRIKGIQRPPLAPLIPTERGVSLLIDCGANVDARAEHLVQFAKMGSIYMEHVVGVKNPKVALVNIGAEEEKGNALVKETMPLLRECTDINFVGSIEARDIPKGDADGQRNGYLKGADAVGKGQRIVALYKIVGGVVDARAGHQREDAGQQEHCHRHFEGDGEHPGEQGEGDHRQQGGCGTVCPQHYGQLVDEPAHGTHQPAEEQAFARA